MNRYFEGVHHEGRMVCITRTRKPCSSSSSTTGGRACVRTGDGAIVRTESHTFTRTGYRASIKTGRMRGQQDVHNQGKRKPCIIMKTDRAYIKAGGRVSSGQRRLCIITTGDDASSGQEGMHRHKPCWWGPLWRQQHCCHPVGAGRGAKENACGCLSNLSKNNVPAANSTAAPKSAA